MYSLAKTICGSLFLLAGALPAPMPAQQECLSHGSVRIQEVLGARDGMRTANDILANLIKEGQRANDKYLKSLVPANNPNISVSLWWNIGSAFAIKQLPSLAHDQICVVIEWSNADSPQLKSMDELLQMAKEKLVSSSFFSAIWKSLESNKDVAALSRSVKQRLSQFFILPIPRWQPIDDRWAVHVATVVPSALFDEGHFPPKNPDERPFYLKERVNHVLRGLYGEGGTRWQDAAIMALNAEKGIDPGLLTAIKSRIRLGDPATGARGYPRFEEDAERIWKEVDRRMTLLSLREDFNLTPQYFASNCRKDVRPIKFEIGSLNSSEFLKNWKELWKKFKRERLGQGSLELAGIFRLNPESADATKQSPAPRARLNSDNDVEFTDSPNPGEYELRLVEANDPPGVCSFYRLHFVAEKQ